MRISRLLRINFNLMLTGIFWMLLITPLMAATVTYSYDSLNRLESAVYPNGTIEYSYDSAGNITQILTPGCDNVFYQDADGDGFGVPDVSILSCSQPDGYAANSTDCNDTAAGINPGAVEVCNDGIDNNCDGLIDCDTDGDGLLDDFEQQIVDDDPGDGIEGIDDVAPDDDYDGDGHTNAEEHEAGTDPTDPESVPVVVADWFVDGAVGSSGTGTSWAEAFATVQEALSAASSGDMVWVKEGTYLLTQELVVNNDINMYGGFPAASSSPAWEDRDSTNYATVLDGQGLVRCLNVEADALIDGFTITGGDAITGGALYTNASPTIAECRIEANSAYYGSGIYSDGGSPVISRCMLLANTAQEGGGGMYVTSGSVEIVNSLFVGNQAMTTGAGLYSATGDTNIFHATFTENTAGFRGGAVYSQGGTVDIVNSILWGDSALQSPEIHNSGSTVTVSYSDIEGSYSGTGNIDSDPLFETVPDAGVDLAWGTADDNFGYLYLQDGSPCVDTGTSTGSPSLDIAGVARPLDGNGLGAGTTGDGSDVDMGAYEYSANQPPIFLSEPRWAEGSWTKLTSDPENPHDPQSQHVLFFAYDDDGLDCQEINTGQINWMYRPVALQEGGGVLPLGDWTIEVPGWSYLYWVLIREPTIADTTGPGLFEFKMSVTDCAGLTTDSENFYGKRYYFQVD